MDTLGMLLLVILGGFVVLIVMVILRYGKCEACGRRKAMEEISCELLEKVPTTVQETRTKKNKEGEVISRWTVDVPATKSIYKVTSKCKYCNYKTSTRRELVRKN